MSSSWAHSLAVEYIHGMDEVRVRLSVGPFLLNDLKHIWAKSDFAKYTRVKQKNKTATCRIGGWLSRSGERSGASPALWLFAEISFRESDFFKIFPRHTEILCEFFQSSFQTREGNMVSGQRIDSSVQTGNNGSLFRFNRFYEAKHNDGQLHPVRSLGVLRD